MDADAGELFERRIAERVETRVRGRLFTFYAALGSVAIAVLGLVGYNITAQLNDKAEEFAISAVKPAIEQAQQAARLAGHEAAQAAAKLEALESFQALREAALVEQEQNIRRSETRVRQMSTDTDQRLTTINTDLTETEKQLSAIREKTEEAAGLGNVAALASTLEELSRQVGLLENQVREIRTRTGGEQAFATRHLLTLVKSMKFKQRRRSKRRLVEMWQIVIAA